MDDAHRSSLARGLNEQSTRRRLLAALAGVAGLHLTEGAAKPARRGRKQRDRRRWPLRTEASPWLRERELTCTDGTTFTGEQVRGGFGRPPHTWRNVTPGAFPAAFTFHASFVTAPDGTVEEEVSFDDTQGVAHHHELVTCSFIIPVGPFTGYTADFVGFFVP
jgi:hypothetical protein